ncbi:hypothetical protein E8E13_009429 [Curvularia kusanoi]|uniref:Uncharacterized protein n=1 Tax=Curvularia kusanoi TaxID=90978 RepID=A0A9P4TG20_CURKU|nr:hypothetical protein E8E13_009429 [Curvularia kusanoi]
MCNGASTRTSQGGSIAVLRPTQHLRRSTPSSDMMLFFHNQLASPGTSVELQGWEEQNENGRHWVVIHQDGDLSAPSSTSPQTAQSPPLYSFDLVGETDAATLHLPQKLDLGVGERGVIGRRVSVMTGSVRGPLTVAEGIIGWN